MGRNPGMAAGDVRGPGAGWTGDSGECWLPRGQLRELPRHDWKRQGGDAEPGRQPKAYIVEQMRAFRDGKRPATIMHQLAKGYTDPQIEAIADYFARQPAAR